MLVLASLGVISTWLNGGAPCRVWEDDGTGGTAVQGAQCVPGMCRGWGRRSDVGEVCPEWEEEAQETG